MSRTKTTLLLTVLVVGAVLASFGAGLAAGQTSTADATIAVDGGDADIYVSDQLVPENTELATRNATVEVNLPSNTNLTTDNISVTSSSATVVGVDRLSDRAIATVSVSEGSSEDVTVDINGNTATVSVSSTSLGEEIVDERDASSLQNSTINVTYDTSELDATRGLVANESSTNPAVLVAFADSNGELIKESRVELQNGSASIEVTQSNDPFLYDQLNQTSGNVTTYVDSQAVEQVRIDGETVYENQALGGTTGGDGPIGELLANPVILVLLVAAAAILITSDP